MTLEFTKITPDRRTVRKRQRPPHAWTILDNTCGKRLSFELINYHEGWERLKNDWRRLFDLCNRPCVFYHPLFLNAARILSPQEQPSHLVLGRQGEKLVFGLAAQIKRSGLFIKALSFYTVSTEGFDHLAPLDITPDQEASREFLNHFDRYWGLNVLRANGVDSEIANVFMKSIDERLKFFKRQTYCCPYLDLPVSENELLLSFSRNLRSQLKRKVTKVEANSMQFRTIFKDTPGYTLQDALNNLYSLHADRFLYLGKSSSFLTASSRTFHVQLCKEAKEFAGIIHFFELLHQDRVIASFYGYLVGKSFYLYQSGFATEYSRHSVGTLLRYKVMLYLIDNGVEVFDFLRGEEKYKFEWTESSVKDFMILASSSLMGGAAINWIRLRRVIKREGKKAGTLHWLYNKD